MTQNQLRERIFGSIDIDGMVGLLSEAVRVPSITGEEENSNVPNKRHI